MPGYDDCEYRTSEDLSGMIYATTPPAGSGGGALRGRHWVRPATGYHDARDSVREAAARGRGTRTDRAYRRGLRGRGQR